MTLYVMRYGETQFNVERRQAGVALNKRGLRRDIPG